MNMKDLIDEATDDGGYDDSGNMFLAETINELMAVKTSLSK